MNVAQLHHDLVSVILSKLASEYKERKASVFTFLFNPEGVAEVADTHFHWLAPTNSPVFFFFSLL